MTSIHLTTEITAKIGVCFDVCRDVDMHKLSTRQTNEQAIAGRTKGLCELGDTITWEAKHFGIKQQLTVVISKFEFPYFFEDTMLSGAFRSMRHEHHFETKGGITIMNDTFEYEVPFGFIGKLFDFLILKRYMMRFLLTRNAFLKEMAERSI